MTRNPDDEYADARERAAALDPTIGAGTPATAPLEDPTVSLLRRQPVLLFALVLMLPTAAAAVAAWAEGRTAIAIVATAASVLIATLTPLVRAAVTPVAAPRLDAETPLAVVGDPAAPPAVR